LNRYAQKDSKEIYFVFWELYLISHDFFEVLHIFCEFSLIKRKKKTAPALGRDSSPRSHCWGAAACSLADPRPKRLGLLCLA
jgi:hypothetical protein